MDLEALGTNWHVWLVTITLVVAAYIDGKQLKVPNWITFPMIASGWVFNLAMFGWEGLGMSLLGTVVGLALLMPAYAIGGMGAGDVKLLAGVGAWMGSSVTFYAFCASAIIGGVIALGMILYRKAWSHHKNQFLTILNEITHGRKSDRVGHDCSGQEEQHAPPALRNSYRHWHHRVLLLDRNAGMNATFASNTALIQTGISATESTSPISDNHAPKVEKVCRLCRRKRRGAAVVEFAIVAPVFFLLVFGMIEYGRMVMVQQILTNASREGARAAVLDGATSSGVEEKVLNYLTSCSINGADVDINPPNPASAGYGTGITVTVTVPFSQVSWLPTPMFPGNQNMTLTANSVMRRESIQ